MSFILTQAALPFMGEALPSPKTRNSSLRGVYSWSPSYAGFSPQFAEGSLKYLHISEEHTVVDPFLGSGTSAVAASFNGCKFIGNDLDPFSALLSKAKTILPPQGKTVLETLGNATTDITLDFPTHAQDCFEPDDLMYASAVFQSLNTTTGKTGTPLLRALLKNPKSQYSSELICLVSLLTAARTASNTSRGSNPVWLKKEGRSAHQKQTSLKDETISTARQILQDLEKRAEYAHHDVAITCGDYEAQKIKERSIDFLITSPPYLNRLDYVVSHLPELLLLAGLIPINLDTLRQKMMGTTKMTPLVDPAETWGKTCLETLNAIRDHQSKASSTYYHKFYCQYFHDLNRFLTWTSRVMKPHGQGLIVIQDSYYKDIKIQIDRVIDEMVEVFGASAAVVRGDSRRNHMGAIDPKQRTYAGTKTLTEMTIHLAF